ncbi:hypothetical protein ABL78_7834 [Leptomonas seymouri]|uniref:Uncharacterized protein n=1 Tax=Leptomonas seymouri TaxID=5684 RepID=A0A0N0P2N1_LEPSE|nr:hypothetical protein ABL78_7834 [Leptomonas seymouri]|eukprot:KPI83146.1 hypothetical protein ABL78_7834 [Leptomonas seymouri]
MLFRGSHESNDVGTIGSRNDGEHSGDEDDTCSTSSRSYTSAESATAQSFEMRMAQLDGNGGLGSGSFPCDGASDRKLLSPAYQLFPICGSPYDNLSGERERGDGPHDLTLVNSISDSKRGDVGTLLSGTRANDYADEDKRDDDYLAALLSNIEQHAARLDTQFFRYPSAETLKQQMIAQAATQDRHAKSLSTCGGPKSCDVATAGEGVAKTEVAENGGVHNTSTEAVPNTLATATATTNNGNGASGSSHSTGTKLFLGGLRYEVIQSGRHTVSWIFQVSCGVHINPSSILIHRKTKNGRSNVAPTGCASVFVANDDDVATLLGMNRRIYCAEEGVYVSPSLEVMKELIASKDIVDVTSGRVRGPTHPVVIERACSVSHSHGHHSNSAGTNNAAGGTAAAGAASSRVHGGNATAAGGNAGGVNSLLGGACNNKSTTSGASGSGAHRNARTLSVLNTENSLSSQPSSGMPPPYGGAMPPQYSTPSVPSTFSNYHSLSYPPSSVSSGSLGGSTVGMPMMGISPRGFPPGTMMMSGQSSLSSQILDDCCNLNTVGPLKLDPQRVTFHAYLQGSKASEQSPKEGCSVGDAESLGVATNAHAVLFLAALPSNATEDYVSWLFSLMSISLPLSRTHIIGGSCTPSTGPGAVPTTADCCATVSVPESDVSIALNFHHRVLCTPRGAWIGHSAQDIAALRASDPALHEAAVLHVNRRMLSHTMKGSGANPAATGAGGSGLPSAYSRSIAMGGAGGRVTPNSGAGASMPPPPTSYSNMFGAMPLPRGMPAGPGGVLPMAAPWCFAAPSANMPPPPSGAMKSGAPCIPPGAVPIPTTMSPGSGYSMPPPPPQFSFAPSVTIGDRTYQLPPGAMVQYMPVITSNQTLSTAGEANADKKHNTD